MNQIAPIFDTRFADFASANQDAIREAMLAVTPFSFRPVPFSANSSKGRSIGKGRADAVLRGMTPRKKYLARDIGEIVGMTAQQVAVAMKDLLKSGRVRRLTGPYQRPAIYMRPK